MRKIKWLAAAAAAAAVTALAAGCSKQEEEQTAAESTAQETVQEPQAEESEEAADEADSSKAEAETGILKGGEPVSVMTGTVLDAAMNSIVIQNEEHPDGIIFSKEDSAASFSDGLKIDMDVTLFYTGTVDGEDTKEADVVLVRESRDSDDTLTAGAVSGTVSGLDEGSVTIEAENGAEGAEKESVSVKRGREILMSSDAGTEGNGGLKEGGRATVLYSCPGGDEETKEAELVIAE